jgi:HJR/Mrr/RecB family endonuclease
MNSIQEYRRKAAQVRRLAKSVSDHAVQEQLSLAAKEYDCMADQLERSSAATERRRGSI